ncbi:MAG: hypothetical protein U0838_00685 [Chloroflexota bacterium]
MKARTGLVIRPVGNGWVVEDRGAGETAVVEETGDAWAALARLLVEVRDRFRGGHDSTREQNVEIVVAPGRKWLAAHPDECEHLRLDRFFDGGVARWTCPCGRELAPVADDAPAAGEP